MEIAKTLPASRAAIPKDAIGWAVAFEWFGLAARQLARKLSAETGQAEDGDAA